MFPYVAPPEAHTLNISNILPELPMYMSPSTMKNPVTVVNKRYNASLVRLLTIKNTKTATTPKIVVIFAAKARVKKSDAIAMFRLLTECETHSPTPHTFNAADNMSPRIAKIECCAEAPTRTIIAEKHASVLSTPKFLRVKNIPPIKRIIPDKLSMYPVIIGSFPISIKPACREKNKGKNRVPPYPKLL